VQQRSTAADPRASVLAVDAWPFAFFELRASLASREVSATRSRSSSARCSSVISGASSLRLAAHAFAASSRHHVSEVILLDCVHPTVQQFRRAAYARIHTRSCFSAVASSAIGRFGSDARSKRTIADAELLWNLRVRDRVKTTGSSRFDKAIAFSTSHRSVARPPPPRDHEYDRIGMRDQAAEPRLQSSPAAMS